MARILHRKKKSLLPPGTAVHVGDRKVENTQITIFEYSGESIVELKTDDPQVCLDHLKTETCTWINIDGLHDVALLDVIAKGIGLHPLVLEDIVNTNQRPKLEEYDGYVFLVSKMLSYDTKRMRAKVEQVSFVLGQRFLISFQEDVGDLFDEIRKRLRTGKGKVRKESTDFLMYSLLDGVVDGYFDVLEMLGNDLERFEDELMTNPTPTTLRSIHGLKRELIFVRRAVWPLRECISVLLREEGPLIQPSTKVFYRDLYDHTIHVIDAVETYRDLSSGMLDLYLSTVSNKMNEVMKVLTVMSSVFVPLTFIAGIYGMNFSDMPELHSRWGYPATLLLMAVIAIGLLVTFRLKKWS